MASKPTYDELADRVKTLELRIAGSGSVSSIKPGHDFQTFTEQSPNMIFIYKRGRVVYANRRCLQIMGYSRKEFFAPDFDFMTLIARESADLIKGNFLRHMQGEDVDPHEYTMVTKYGEKIAAIITAKLIDYESGPAILGIVTDITERKRAEDELQYRLKFQHLITHVSSRFINLDPAQIDGEMTNTLQQIGEFAAADRSYVFQFSDNLEFVSCTHEWCAEDIEPAIERIQNVPLDTFPWSMGKFLRGEMFVVPSVSDLPPEANNEKLEFERQRIQSILAVPMASGGRVLGFIGLDSVREEKMWAEDTNSLLSIVGNVFANALDNQKTRQALEESEERLRTVFETFPDPVTIIRADDGRCDDVNSAFTRLTGWRRDEVIGKTAADLNIWYNPDDREKLTAGIVNHGRIENIEAKFNLKNGGVITALMSAVLINFKDRPHILTITRDISELKAAQQERERLKAQLIQAHRMEAIGTLAGGIAHDFNNILGAIIGFTEMALYDTLEGTMERYNMEQVLKAGHRAKDLVKQILAFSRKSEQDKKVIYITPIIKEAIGLLRASLPTTVEIKQDIKPNLGPIFADPTQIHQVLMNLCTNSAHAMEAAGGILKITLNSTTIGVQAVSSNPELSQPGDYLQLTVEDTGHGMDDATLKRIFDPYFTTKKVGKGTGMGLSVVHGIVRGHGGTVTVDSTLNEGTRVDIFFPIVKREPESDIEKLKAATRGNECILFIDDEQSLNNLAKSMLQKLGYRAVTCSDPIEAIAAFKAEPETFDLVVSDMTMPHMTGDRLAEEVMKIRPDIPVIICTGYSERLDSVRASAIGIKGFLKKPFTILEFSETLRQILDRNG